MALIWHTADWHLGARLLNAERFEEQSLWLKWLLDAMEVRRPDLLVIAGDVFDTANPSSAVLAQYYHFLAGVVARTQTRVLVLGGNHDSPLTLNAPRELLRSLRVYVIGGAPQNQEDAIFEFDDFILAAVPFLRERDVRRAAPGQSYEEVAAQIRDGIAAYYQAILKQARAKSLAKPILATGHLTALGVTRSLSERDIHIGNLGAVSADCFAGFGYVALGHIHKPQPVGGNPLIRYSGSPLALGFDETDVPRQFLEISVTQGQPLQVEPVAVPCFRPLHRISCPKAEIRPVLERLPLSSGLTPWVELTVTDGLHQPDLQNVVREAAAGLPVVVLKILVPPLTAEGTDSGDLLSVTPSLQELRPQDVFAERLRQSQVDPESEEGRILTGTFAELLTRMEEAPA